MNKESLKKHHFWIMVGFVPLLVLIAVVTITSAVGGKIEEKKAAIKKEQDALNNKNPKSNKFLDRVDEQVVKLGQKRTDLWQDNWERQIGVVKRTEGDKRVRSQDKARNLIRWPKSPKLTRFNYDENYATDKNQLKFGAKIPSENGEFNEFQKPEVYLAEFTNPFLRDPAREPEKRTGMADMVYPTAFVNGWQATLRHVNDWGERVPDSEQMWLVLEDIWVQRAMLTAVKTVNDEIGHFEKAQRFENGKPVADSNPLERSFRSRIWQVNLKLAQRPADQKWVMTGSLRNLTDRLQLLGNGNTMVLNVWLSPDPNARPFAFKIGGEFVPGATTMPVTEANEHVLPPGMIPTEIHRVEQAFDTRTIPIRRIDHLALGKRDSRFAAKPLALPNFKKFEDEEAAAATAGTTTGGPMGMGSVGGPPPGSAGGPPPGARGSGAGTFPGAPGGGPGAAVDWFEGGGDVATAIDANKKRYVEKPTAQVRRMPVAITLVVDQAYMQDVLLAYANSPLRFQITQVDWQRFRGQLGTGSGSGDGFGTPGEEVVGSARGTTGKGFEYGGGLMPSVGRFGSGGGPPPGPGGPPPMPGAAGPGAFGMGGMYGGGSMTTLTESQLTAGLVELTVYGIVSLYEKYEAPAAAADQQPAK